jgi:hypothetical protein
MKTLLWKGQRADGAGSPIDIRTSNRRNSSPEQAKRPYFSLARDYDRAEMIAAAAVVMLIAADPG